MSTQIIHQPVLLSEVIKALNPKPNKWYLDGTLGGGGHTIELLKKNAKVLAFDQDEEAINRARNNVIAACPGAKIVLYANQTINISDFDLILVNKNFSEIDIVVPHLQSLELSGAMLDLGISTYQLLDPNRGFSFQYDTDLDMRMDKRLGVTAADLVNALPQKQLEELFKEHGDETYSYKIAKAIVEKRALKPFKTTKDLADLISRIKPSGKVHPATQVFQALRIAVNLESHSLKEALPKIVDLLEPNSTLAIISFHSGEDRIVKNFFKESKNLEVLTKTPITPTQEEINKNISSRSAKLRLAIKNENQTTNNQKPTSQP